MVGAQRHADRYSGVDTVVFINKRLMSLFIGAECTGDVLTQIHALTTLIIEA
jgi:hypothetical protein